MGEKVRSGTSMAVLRGEMGGKIWLNKGGSSKRDAYEI